MIHTLINVVRGFLVRDGALILPEMELVLFACGILLIDRWLAANEKHWNALLALAGTAFSGFTLYVQHGKMQALRDANPESPGLLGLHQSVLVDPFFLFFATLFLVATALIILLSARYLETEEHGHGAYYALLLFACVGMMLMVSGVDLLVVLLGLEVMGLSSCLLAAFSESKPRGHGAARSYAFLWAFSSFSLAGGLLMLYRLFQTTNLGRVGAILEVRVDNGMPFGGLTAWPAMLALVLLSAGAFFLIDAGLFHWFAPRISVSAGTVAGYLSMAAKTAGFALLLRFFSFLFVFAHQKWIHVWGGAAIVSLLWGNIGALRQTNVKRLLAYGSVAQTGFILLGLVAGNEAGFSGMMYYLGVNIFMTAGAFGILIVLQQRGAAGMELADLDGLYQRSPAAALLLLIFMMSLAGTPPTAGFLAKYYIVKALMAAPHPELAAFAVVNALLAVYYYGRIVAHAWKKPSADTPLFEAPALPISSGQTVALTATVFVSLAAGLYPEPFLRLARYAFGQ
ncbi:MAG TPA: NADH-quinone oxidoreductase subunit N [Candidatus Cybelea sp.]|jgi:NADH-quinone oxidoreductase subunit N|nr:NADH-quinone oxidoreductase subunit N [Candidatus Cybelea sp.]